MDQHKIHNDIKRFQHLDLAFDGHFRLLRLIAGHPQDDVVCFLQPFKIDSEDRPDLEQFLTRGVLMRRLIPFILAIGYLEIEYMNQSV